MSPLTASVNESSGGELVALVKFAEFVELISVLKVLVVAAVRESNELVAHAVSATTKAQNLISLLKRIQKILRYFLSLWDLSCKISFVGHARVCPAIHQ